MISKRISPMNSAVRNPAVIGMMNGMPYDIQTLPAYR